mmetsp:Transcript_26779/g.67164  ORF Transcript_26779/g.67164 Transcript_26779/m.67164 type:complete len:150 (+) Transcript_26779:190-639(+)
MSMAVQSSANLLASLQTFEDEFLKESAKQTPSPQVKFDYAWRLLRSSNEHLIKKGLLILQGLLEDGFCDQDCLYYMALGHYRIGDTKRAQQCVDSLLGTHPNHRLALSLSDVIADRVETEQRVGASAVVAVAVAAVAMVAIAKAVRRAG